MSRKIFLISVSFLTALLARAAQSWACAVCLGGANDSVTEGYNASVLFLMATPYLVGASIVGGLIWAYRRTRGEESDDDAAGLQFNQEDSSR
jgi:hypothetical protein